MKVSNQLELRVTDLDLSDADCNNIQSTEEHIFIDIETTGLNLDKDFIKLIQIYMPFNQAVILIRVDPKVYPSRIASVMSNKKIRKTFHHAIFDVRFLYKIYGISSQSIGCTKIASKIVHSTEENHSLKTIAKRIIGIEIDKAQQKSDWDKVRLTPEQIEYACRDVIFLNDILMALMDEASEEQKKLIKKSFEYIYTRAVLDVEKVGDVFMY